MLDLERQLETIKGATLKKIPEVEKIYLFGSYAYGNPEEDSDIDIFVVIPNRKRNIINLETNIRGEIAKTGFIDFDMLIETKERFEYRRERNRLERTVYSRGRLLYDRAG